MSRVKNWMVRLLLRLLNTDFLNHSPCRYGWINNIDAFSYETLVYEEAMRPGITVRTVIEEADRWKTCPINKNGLTVLESDGTSHGATVWDRHELNIAMTPKDLSDD